MFMSTSQPGMPGLPDLALMLDYINVIAMIVTSQHLPLPAEAPDDEAATESIRDIDAEPHLDVRAERMGGLLGRSGEAGMTRS